MSDKNIYFIRKKVILCQSIALLGINIYKNEIQDKFINVLLPELKKSIALSRAESYDSSSMNTTKAGCVVIGHCRQ